MNSIKVFDYLFKEKKTYSFDMTMVIDLLSNYC